MHQVSPFLILAGLTVVIVLLLWWSLSLGRAKDACTILGMGQGTRFFLVLLRLAIGWHFLVEGLDKVKSGAWSAEAYLRESAGPLAPLFRDLAEDSLRDRLTPGPKATESMALLGGSSVGLLAWPAPLQQANAAMVLALIPGQMAGVFPTTLDSEWEAHFQQFVNHYHLDVEQTASARTQLEKARAMTVLWLMGQTKETLVPSTQPPPLNLPLTVAQRIQAYQKSEEQARIIEKDLPHYGSEAWTRLRTAKTDATRLRGELTKELTEQTANLTKGLRLVLSEDQKEIRVPRYPAKRSIATWTLLDWSDAMVQYGLVAVGLCLLLGVVTRLACVGGAALLLLFYLAMPPLPGLPENPKAEGHYLFINKNIIEMLALLVLASTRSGRWLGLDGLLQFFQSRRKAAAAWQASALAGAETLVGSTPVPTTPSAKEKRHGS